MSCSKQANLISRMHTYLAIKYLGLLQLGVLAVSAEQPERRPTIVYSLGSVPEYSKTPFNFDQCLAGGIAIEW